jgi:hypothetical protein
VERVVSAAIGGACLIFILSLTMPAFAGLKTAENKPVEAAPSPEMAARGKALFNGARPFTKGGAPCAACHSFRTPGITGGNLATDLTDHYEGMGDEGFREVLKSLDFPVMKKIYADHPLTDEEIAALLVFARDAATGKKGSASFLFTLAGLGVFGCCLAVLMIYKRRIG